MVSTPPTGCIGFVLASIIGHSNQDTGSLEDYSSFVYLLVGSMQGSGCSFRLNPGLLAVRVLGFGC